MSERAVSEPAPAACIRRTSYALTAGALRVTPRIALNYASYVGYASKSMKGENESNASGGPHERHHIVSGTAAAMPLPSVGYRHRASAPDPVSCSALPPNSPPASDRRWSAPVQSIGTVSEGRRARLHNPRIPDDTITLMCQLARLTALRMLRRGDIKGRQVCPGAPWMIRTADLVRFTDRERSDRPLTPNPDQRAFDFQ